MRQRNSEALARKVIHELKARGFIALLVGGCVRDLLLGLTPKDWDVATDARPEQIQPLFPDSLLVGAQFGVLLVRQGPVQVEVATFRSDVEYRDGRRPQSVVYETDPRKDAERRDFTINGLFFDTGTDQVIDFVGGQADLKNRVVRAIGEPERRFREDYLRLLRAVRFAARLEFEMDAETWAALSRLAPLSKQIAAERVRDELTRILTEGDARRGLEMLDSSGLLQALLPEVAAMKGVEQPPRYHPEGDVWEHTLLVMNQLFHPSPALAWGALLHDVGKPPTFRVAERIRFDGHVEEGVKIARRILNRLRFPTAECEQIVALIANHMKFMHALEMRESTLKKFVRQPRFDEHLELHRADVLSSNGNLTAYEFVRERLDAFSEDHLKPEPLITGRDLIGMGMRPGPLFSRILTQLEDQQLEGLLKTREEALAWVNQNFMAH